MIARVGRPDGRNKRLLWIGEFRLRFRKRSGDRPNGFARPLHGASQNSRRSKLTAPDFERLARTPLPVASFASSGIRVLSSDLARSWSRNAERGAQKRPANPPQEFEPLISTKRTASTRGRGGSIP